MCNVNVLWELIPLCNQQSLFWIYFQKMIGFFLNHSMKAFERFRNSFTRKINKNYKYCAPTRMQETSKENEQTYTKLLHFTVLNALTQPEKLHVSQSLFVL